MDKKETNAQVPSKTSSPDRAVILKLLVFIERLSSHQSSQDDESEQVSLPPISQSK
jgi:hypothetical protein